MDALFAGILDVMIKIHGTWGADPGVADVCEKIKEYLTMPL